MDLGLRDKIVLVTGGAKGIGAATVKAFLVEDCKVVIVDRDTKAGPILAKSSGSKARFVEADLTNLKSCKKAVEQTVSWFGGLDVLVNNAGFNDGLGLETSAVDFMTSVQNNLLHVYAMTHYSLPLLRKGPGSILNIGSKIPVTGKARLQLMPPQRGQSARSPANGR